jgi:hypothetical protein
MRRLKAGSGLIARREGGATGRWPREPARRRRPISVAARGVASAGESPVPESPWEDSAYDACVACMARSGTHEAHAAWLARGPASDG